jgi:hypothetical protein
MSSRYFRSSDSHRSCESVLPLDSASKDVKNSSLLSDTLEELDNMTETLSKMSENRDDNGKLLKQKKSLIKSIWTSVCISQFILEDGGILDPTDDKSIT